MLMFLRYSPYSLPNFNSGAAMAAGLSAGAHQVHPQVGLLTYKLTLPWFSKNQVSSLLAKSANMRNPLQLVQSQSGVTGAGLQQYTVTSPLMSQASTTQVRATIIFTLVTGHKSIIIIMISSSHRLLQPRASLHLALLESPPSTPLVKVFIRL